MSNVLTPLPWKEGEEAKHASGHQPHLLSSNSFGPQTANATGDFSRNQRPSDNNLSIARSGGGQSSLQALLNTGP